MSFSVLLWREDYDCGGRDSDCGGMWCLMLREMAGNMHSLHGTSSWGDTIPPFLQCLNTDAVNSIIVRGNTSSRIERMQQEVLDCL